MIHQPFGLRITSDHRCRQDMFGRVHEASRLVQPAVKALGRSMGRSARERNSTVRQASGSTSRPAAPSGRTEVRGGAGRPATPVVDIAIGAGAEGDETCEEACTMLGNNPAGCEFGSGTGVAP